MKVSITVVDDHTVYEHGRSEVKERVRVSVVDLSGPGFVIAGFLRAIADDIDPRAIEFHRQESDA